MVYNGKEVHTRETFDYSKAQVGDLVMSHVKRKYGIKDFGKIMPGHGGLLDRFDSILAVALILIVACEILGKFGIVLFD